MKVGSLVSRVATLGLAAGFCLVTAQDAPEPRLPVAKPPQTLEAYGTSDSTCREWTDGCATCLRRDDGSAGCSTPGIACQPTGLTCSRQADTVAPPDSSSKPDK